MPTLSTWLRQPIQLPQTLLRLAAQVRHRMWLHLRSQAALATETLFLKTQLALYPEPNPRWQCDSNVTRFTRVWRSDGLDWQPALTVVQPETVKRWRRQGGHVDGASSAPTPPHLPGTTYEDPPMGRVRQPTDMVQWDITQGEGMLMSHVVEATYVNGILKLEQPLPFKDQEKVRVTVERLTAEGHSVMDIELVSLGQVRRVLSADDDLLGEMLEGR